MTKEADPLVAALRALAEREEGGVRTIAAKIKSNWQALDQIVKGVQLPSGNPRSVGPQLRGKLSAAYPDWLGDENIEPGPHAYGPYPLISEVQAGKWTEIRENFQPEDAEHWQTSSKNLGKNGYLVRVRGLSMYAPGEKYSFPEDIILHVNPDLDPRPGQFVIARREVSNEATFKKYILIDGVPYLEAINPNWPKEEKYLKLMPGDVWCGVVRDASFGNLP